MTRSTGVGRGKGGGGPKPGAGRPRLQFDAPCGSDAGGQPRKSPRRRIRSAGQLVGKAFETLEFVMGNSPSPAARVAAAKVVIELAKAEAIDGDLYPNARQSCADSGDWDGLLDAEA